MRDRQRLDPLEWFGSACLTLLVSAAALAIAIHLLQSIWGWLVGFGVIALVAVVGWRLWDRRQPW